jgi:protein SCO1
VVVELEYPPRVPTVRFVTTTLGLALAIGGCASGHSKRHASFAGAAYPPGVVAHGFTLEDQRGRAVSLGSYRGQVVALAFLPSPTCRTCVLVAQQVRGALDELESHSARPNMKTLFASSRAAAPHARVGQLLSQTSLTGRVDYLTGTPKELGPVWRAYGVPPPNAGRKAAEAAVAVLLIDSKGLVRVGFGLEQITPEGLSHDIRLLAGG